MRRRHWQLASLLFACFVAAAAQQTSNSTVNQLQARGTFLLHLSELGNWHVGSKAVRVATGILFDFKDAIDNWKDFSTDYSIQGWDTGTDVCSWTGVVCNATGFVTEL